MVAHQLINEDCVKYLERAVQSGRRWECVILDPPDNIGRKYAGVDDKRSDEEYCSLVSDALDLSCQVSHRVWLSFNSRHLLSFASLVDSLVVKHGFLFRPCVQTFTFYQHNKHELGNAHRPLWRLFAPKAKKYPEQCLIPSWRLQNGDKRASKQGKVPGDVYDGTGQLDEDDTVFDYPRVTGNSKQKRRWHDNQLHEGLIERVIRFSTKENETVLDCFGGTGVTLRVAERINRIATLVELSETYCSHISEENNVAIDPQKLYF